MTASDLMVFWRYSSACMVCGAACPAVSALQLVLPPMRAAASAQRWFRRSLGPQAITSILVYIIFALNLFARATNLLMISR